MSLADRLRRLDDRVLSPPRADYREHTRMALGALVPIAYLLVQALREGSVAGVLIALALATFFAMFALRARRGSPIVPADSARLFSLGVMFLGFAVSWPFVSPGDQTGLIVFLSAAYGLIGAIALGAALRRARRPAVSPVGQPRSG